MTLDKTKIIVFIFITKYGHGLISADSDHQMVIGQIISRIDFLIGQTDKLQKSELNYL